MMYRGLLGLFIFLLAVPASAHRFERRNPGVRVKQIFGDEPSDLLSSPTGITEDSEGNLYISDTSNSVIRKYDAAGNQILTIGRRGNFRGALNAPVEIEIFDDVLYIAEVGGPHISRYTLDGHFIDRIGDGDLVGPRSVVIDDDGTIFALDEFSNRLVAFDQHGNKVSECMPVGLTFPNDVFLQDGVFFVANTSAHNILKLDRDCNVLAVGGSFGTAPGQFNLPRSVFIEDDLIYIADSLNNRIQIFDTDLNFEDLFGGFPILFGPGNAIVRADGTIAVVETGRSLITFFAPDNLVVPSGSIGLPRDREGVMNSPGGMGLDEEAGELYISDTNNGRVQVFDFHTGEFKRAFGTPGFGFVPGDTFFSNSATLINDLVYVASALHQIVVFDKQGTEVDRIGEFGFGPGQFFFPLDVQADSLGNFYVVDSFNNRVQKFDPDFNFVQAIGFGLLFQPTRVFVDKQDRLFVSDTNNNLVRIFDSVSGAELANFGGFGQGDGATFLPQGIAMDKQETVIVVTESGNNRLSVFENREGFEFIDTFSSLGSTRSDIFFPVAAIQ
ncbi:MAG: NHL repeat-containing protein, partial [Myxococcota bacterium]